MVVVGGVETNFWVSSKELDNRNILYDKFQMCLPDNWGREVQNFELNPSVSVS